MKPEENDRVKGLLEGEWTAQARKAEVFLRPPRRLVASLLAEDRITVQDLLGAERTYASPARSKDIRRTLRAHWETKDGVYDPAEIELRDSFDELLTVLQLLELSAESGYLPEHVVRPLGRERLLNALWPAGARLFVKHYDYLGVRFLAARCDIDLGLPKVIPPHPDPRAQVQFATFLSQHQGWYGDESLDWWLGLLDDYVGEEGEFDQPEDEAFYSFLRTGRLPGENRDVERRFYARADGLKRFLFLLANLFSFLPQRSAPFYGFFYLYWMAKFFGYELSDDGYHRDRELYYDWSRIAIGPVLCPPPEGPDEDKLHRERKAVLAEQIQIIKEGFKATESFVRSHL